MKSMFSLTKKDGIVFIHRKDDGTYAIREVCVSRTTSEELLTLSEIDSSIERNEPVDIEIFYNIHGAFHYWGINLNKLPQNTLKIIRQFARKADKKSQKMFWYK